MPQKVAAELLDLNRVRGVVLARAEPAREPELAEALLDREAVDQQEAVLEAVEAALGEADHSLALQNKIIGPPLRVYSAMPFHFICGIRSRWFGSVKCRPCNTGSCVGTTAAV
jgi:hypothetical protein